MMERCQSAEGVPARRGFLLQDLDISDSAILKMLAITAIALHNFFHLVSPARQNEFWFDPSRFTVFLQTIQHPGLAVQACFSFFGHFGLQVFIFLSAYGLAKSHWDDGEPWAAFMWGRIRKLYPPVLLIVGGWAFGKAVMVGPILFAKQMGLHLVLMLLGVSTLAGFGLPAIGPWWFIPFIIQFYAIWPFLKKLTYRFGWRALLALSIGSLILVWFFNPPLKQWSINLLLTPIGRLPVLCIGIAAARYRVRLNGVVAALALAVLLLGCQYEPLWLLTMPAALLVTLWTYSRVRRHLHGCGWLRRLGQYSLLVFLLNAPVRNDFMGLLSLGSMKSYGQAAGLQLLIGFTSTAFTFVLAAIIHHLLMSPVRSRGAARAKGGRVAPMNSGLFPPGSLPVQPEAEGGGE